MWSNNRCQRVLVAVRHYSRISPPRPVCVEPVIRVTNNVSHLDSPKEGPKPRQFLSLLSFPGHPLPGKNSDGVPGKHARVTAISWVKYYFDEIWEVQMEDQISDNSSIEKKGKTKSMSKIKPNEVMAAGAKVYVPVSIAETRISKRYDTVPSGTLYPNANEIEYLQGLVKYKDSAIIVLNKPPKLPVKGNLPVHNSMDALVAAVLSYDNDKGPKLVWNDACEATYQRYWALVIGCPKERAGVISAPLSKVLLNDGKTERVMLANQSGLEASQEAITEYRVIGPTINGCSWIELCHLLIRSISYGSIVLKHLAHQLWVTTNMVDLCTGDGDRCLELILSQQLGNHASCGGQEAWMFRREAC